MMRYGWIILLFMIVGISSAQDDGESRHFYMGFTPFPYEVSTRGVAFTYDTIREDADLVAHHFDSGVPWVEALSGDPYHATLMGDWFARRAFTPEGHQVYLSLTPINFERNGLAAYRAEAEHMPLPAPWNIYNFDHPDVKQAYLNYVTEAVEYFQPDYLAIGIEVNLLYNESPDDWSAYMELQRDTYTALKQHYPDLPVFVSVLGVAFLDGYRNEDDPIAQRDILTDILDYSDYFALSLYPYLTNYLASRVPDTLWDDLSSLTDKPIAIAETGYPAQAFSVFDGTIPVNGTPQKQEAYISRLLQEAQTREFEFVIQFIIRDYDAVFEAINGGDLEILWRDTGLFDEDGQPRPALDIWRAWLSRPVDD